MDELLDNMLPKNITEELKAMSRGSLEFGPAKEPTEVGYFFGILPPSGSSGFG
jgi:hypothetical protein